MGKFITNSFKLRKADESRKNVPFEYYAVFRERNLIFLSSMFLGKEKYLAAVLILQRWFFCLLGQNLMKMR